MRELITVSKPKLLYREGLPADESKPTLSLTPAEFEAKFGCAYTESILTTAASTSVLTKADFQSSQRLRRVFDRLQNPLRGLLIADMGNNVGHGLFTSRLIKRGTIIGHYAGKIVKESDSVYDFEIAHTDSKIDACYHGGLARFMQHLPLSREVFTNYYDAMLSQPELLALDRDISIKQANKLLSNDAGKEKVAANNRATLHFKEGSFQFDDYRFNSIETRQNTAVANVIPVQLVVNQVPLIIFIAMRDIAPNELVGFSYSQSYSRNRQQELMLFNRQGGLLHRDTDFTLNIQESNPVDPMEAMKALSERLVMAEQLSFGSTTVTRIGYMNNPPVFGGIPRNVGMTEFHLRFGYTYVEGILGLNHEYSDQFVKQSDNALLRSAYHRILNPLDGLTVCKINDEVGHGLFTRKPIPVGTVLCIYSGQYEPARVGSIYARGNIDAARFGGIARFMQHLPISKLDFEGFHHALNQDPKFHAMMRDMSVEEARQRLRDPDYLQECRKFAQLHILYNESKNLFDYDAIKHRLSGQACESVARSNVIFEEVPLGEAKIEVAIAIRNIEANEIIGFSYRQGYWLNPKMNTIQKFFDRQGRVLPVSLSTHRSTHNTLEAVLKKYQLESEAVLPSKEKALRRAAAFNKEGYLDDMRVLIEAGVDIDAKDDNPRNERTALHWAVIRQNPQAVELLLRHNANKSVLDCAGLFPHQYAEKEGYPDNGVSRLFTEITEGRPSTQLDLMKMQEIVSSGSSTPLSKEPRKLLIVEPADESSNFLQAEQYSQPTESGAESEDTVQEEADNPANRPS